MTIFCVFAMTDYFVIILVVDAVVEKKQGRFPDEGEAEDPRPQGVHSQQGAHLLGQVQVRLRTRLREHVHQQLQGSEGIAY